MLLYSRGYIWYTEICYNLKNIHYKLYILSPSINANRSQRQLDTYNSFKISSNKKISQWVGSFFHHQNCQTNAHVVFLHPKNPHRNKKRFFLPVIYIDELSRMIKVMEKEIVSNERQILECKEAIDQRRRKVLEYQERIIDVKKQIDGHD